MMKGEEARPGGSHEEGGPKLRSAGGSGMRIRPRRRCAGTRACRWAANGSSRGMGGPGMAGGNAPAARGGSQTTGSAARTGKTVDQLLAQNTKLSEQLQNLLGPGVNLQQAASGFKNLGQFVAAVHVSKNLNIPFDQLKAEMLKTGSLGKAIKTLDPKLSSAQVREEVRKAQQQARQDIRSSRQRPS